MRVLFVVRPCQGGMQSHINTLVSGLLEQGQSVFVASPQLEYKRKGVGMFYLPLGTNPVRFWNSIYILKSLLRELAPDVVHFHGALAALLGLGVPKAQSTWVYTAHNFSSTGISGYLVRNSWLAKKMDAVIAVSESLADALIDQGVPQEKIAVIHNGIDLELFTPEPFICQQRDPLFLGIGRLVPEKGFAYLLEAVAQVKAAGWRRVRLIIAGDGPMRPHLANLVQELNINDMVQFAGHVSNPHRLLQDTFAVVTPSLYEGLGIVNIEAMAMGRPVISTRTGGISEVVVHGETGLLVPPKTSGALAEAMILLLGSPGTAERMGMAGALRAHAHFSAKNMTAATLRVYREALEV